MINQSMKKKAFWESDGQSIDEKRAFSASDDQSINKWGKSILRIWWSINQSMRRKRAFWESDDQSRSCSQVTAALRGTDIKPVIPSSNIPDVRFPILSDFQIFQIVAPWLLFCYSIWLNRYKASHALFKHPRLQISNPVRFPNLSDCWTLIIILRFNLTPAIYVQSSSSTILSLWYPKKLDPDLLSQFSQFNLTAHLWWLSQSVTRYCGQLDNIDRTD